MDNVGIRHAFHDFLESTDGKLTIEQRLAVEEEIRLIVYSMIDCADRPSLNMGPEETKVWEELHKAVQVVATFYEKKGMTVYKH
jgi:hypothetical protein